MPAFSQTPSGTSDLSRRELLRAGVGAGISLFLQSAAVSDETDVARRRVEKTIPTIVWISFDGGKSSFESYDPKPDNADARGPFGVIDTAVTGVKFSEHCVHMAREGFRNGILLRAVQTQARNLDHTTGMREMLGATGRNGVDQHVLSRFAQANGGIAPFFAQSPSVIDGFEYNRLAWGMPGLMLNMPYDPRTKRLQAPEFRPMDDRLRDERLPLLAAFERNAPVIESESAKRMDRVRNQAIDLMRRANGAVRLTDKDLEPYGGVTAVPEAQNWAKRDTMESIAPILATVRRLIEQDFTGAIGVRLGYYDLHSYLEDGTRLQEPVVDRALATFLAELRERRLFNKTVVVCASEFGRTPRINFQNLGSGTPGRDHATTSSAWLFGGSLRSGMVHGSTDRNGNADRDCVTMADIHAIVGEAIAIQPDRAKRSRLPPLFT